MEQTSIFSSSNFEISEISKEKQKIVFESIETTPLGISLKLPANPELEVREITEIEPVEEPPKQGAFTTFLS